jgi:hypothetical protein
MRSSRIGQIEFVVSLQDTHLLILETTCRRSSIASPNTRLLAWVPFHEKEPRGIASETDTHFVHFFGKDRGLWVISTGLTDAGQVRHAP